MFKFCFSALERLAFFGFPFFAITFFLGGELVAAQVQTPEETQIEEMMMIHYLNPGMKSDYDWVKVTGKGVDISVWRDLPPNPDSESLQCLAYEWLLTGRGQKMGLGAYEIFRNFPLLEEISLQFVDLKFEVESKDGKGRFTRAVKPKVYLKAKILKSEIQKYKIENSELRTRMQSNLKTCLGIGRSLNIATEVNL